VLYLCICLCLCLSAAISPTESSLPLLSSPLPILSFSSLCLYFVFCPLPFCRSSYLFSFLLLLFYSSVLSSLNVTSLPFPLPYFVSIISFHFFSSLLLSLGAVRVEESSVPSGSLFDTHTDSDTDIGTVYVHITLYSPLHTTLHYTASC
jgi:hypothetical protein